jgi:predicted nucleotidyltransferase
MATALELKREGWRRFAKTGTLRCTPAVVSPKSLKEREELLDRVRKAAALIKEKFGVRRVILIGSLAHASWFTPESDVDIVVEGLANRWYWEAWKTLEDEVADRPVDLIDLESAAEPLKRAIYRHGIDL